MEKMEKILKEAVCFTDCQGSVMAWACFSWYEIYL